MPTYEYECTSCGKRFEVFQRMTEEPLERCEDCSGRLKRLIGAGAGILFKGSGFYCTDYRSDGYREAAKKESAAGESGTASSEKPAEKKKTKESTEKAPASSASKD